MILTVAVEETLIKQGRGKKDLFDGRLRWSVAEKLQKKNPGAHDNLPLCTKFT